MTNEELARLATEVVSAGKRLSLARAEAESFENRKTDQYYRATIRWNGPGIEGHRSVPITPVVEDEVARILREAVLVAENEWDRAMEALRENR